MTDLLERSASQGPLPEIGNRNQRDLFAMAELSRTICARLGCIPFAILPHHCWISSVSSVAPGTSPTQRSQLIMNDDPERFSDTVTPSDLDLIRQMADGDARAFAKFYDRHSPLLFSIALKVLGDRLEAEEAWQDSARTIWEHAPLYQASRGKPLSWAVVITRNKAIDRLRAIQRRSDAVERIMKEATTNTGEQGTPAVNIAIGKETAAALRTALGTLPAEQRTAIQLAFFTGLSQSEIAVQLGQPLGTIKARIRRGMITLRDVLEESL
jgi:RNA polymerase sigma-70 factor, ECF subfamily